jgi:hypothetical protein
VVASSLGQLEAVFSKVSDPRKARGVRHPFSGIVSLVFLGLLGRITEMAVVVRWANAIDPCIANDLGRSPVSPAEPP